MPAISGIHHVSITVPDIERSVPWYSDVLGLSRLMEETHPDGTGYAVILGKPDWSMCVGLHTQRIYQKRVRATVIVKCIEHDFHGVVVENIFAARKTSANLRGFAVERHENCI